MFLKASDPQLVQINKLLIAIYLKEIKILSALTDLQGATAKLSASTSAELKAIADKLASFGDSVSGPDVENAVAQINAVAGQLDAETAVLTGTATATVTGTGTI